MSIPTLHGNEPRTNAIIACCGDDGTQSLLLSTQFELAICVKELYYMFAGFRWEKTRACGKLQPFGTMLEEAIPKCLEYAMEQEEKTYTAAVEVAEYLKDRRHKLKLTQQAVADKARIQLQQYQKFEGGQRNILTVSFTVACAVLNALDFDISVFTALKKQFSNDRK